MHRRDMPSGAVSRALPGRMGIIFSATSDLCFGPVSGAGRKVPHRSFILAMTAIFKGEWPRVTAPLDALCEGLVPGALSATLEMRLRGIAVESLALTSGALTSGALTFGTCFALLAAYRPGMIRAAEKLTMGVVAATDGIALVHFLKVIPVLFHFEERVVRVLRIFGSGPLGILFSVAVGSVAALNLIPDFAEIVSAFGLIVRLVWLCLEIILLSKLRDDRG